MKKRMNLKKKKNKHFKRIKIAAYITIMYIGFAYTFYYSIKSNKVVSNEEFINLLVTSGNANILNDYKVSKVVNGTMKFIFKIDFTKPNSLLNSSILRFGKNEVKSTVKEISLEYNDDYSNMEELKDISDYIEDPNPSDINSPIIYLYNTHQLENYSNNNLDIYGITPNVLMASYVLRENLNKLGLSTIVEETNMSDFLSKRNWNYAYSYQASRELIMTKKNKYSSLKYFIDIHRDSVGKNYTTANINGKNYAKILFVIGTEHNNWKANNKLANDLKSLFDKNYPSLIRGIMQKSGKNVNGIYNQDISSNSLLLEVGGIDNNIDEVYNTMDAIANILFKYIKGEN